MSISNEILSIILGGGAGSRLYPLTASRSKPAVPIAGKYRLVDIPISNCMNSGINRMFVLTQFNSASLNRHIKNTYHFSAFSSAFVDILAAEQTPDNPTWYQGTADAVRQCLRHVAPFESEYILILSGDQLYQMDFTDMLEHHKNSGADISIATIPVSEKDATEFGIMKKNEKGFITSFIEKPKKEVLPEWASDTGKEMRKKGKNYLASMGIYIFSRKLLFEFLQNKFVHATDFGKEIIPESIGQSKVVSYQYNGYWTDIGNIHSFFEANIGLTDDIPDFNLFDNTRSIYTRPRMLPPAKVSATLEKVVIAEGSIINASRMERSVVGIRTRIGHDSTIVNSYLMGSDYFETIADMNADQAKGIPFLGVGSRTFIKNAILDKNCRVGDDVRINGGTHLENTDHALYTIKDGIVVIKKGAIIPNGFVI
jgi:glucose-1-phosphate adenylyltransferase